MLNLKDGSAVQNMASTTAERKPYNPPVLKFFGAVTQFTQGSLGTVGDAGSQTMKPSDVRLKGNIVFVDRHPLGFGLYLFDYRISADSPIVLPHGRQFGVLAQEVEAVLPEAVVICADGFRRVNYAMLGISQTESKLH